MAFIRLTDIQLTGLDDDEIVAYGRLARDHRDLSAARDALAVLVYGHEPNVRRRVSIRVGAHHVEEVTHDVLVRAVAAAFDGSSVGAFRSWLNTILDRTVADHYRRAERRPKETALPSEHLANEEVWGQEPSVDGEAEAVELTIVLEQVLATFNPNHREVIALHVLGGLPAPVVCVRIDGMSEANVAQIASRFRSRLRAELEAEPRGER
jgi:RNA polymerase sigma factor (sigma-70 family)